MLLFLFILCTLGVACHSLPQGYNYQVQTSLSSDGNDLQYGKYLQQLTQQAPQPSTKFINIPASNADLAILLPTHTTQNGLNGGYQFANQAPQLVGYEQQNLHVQQPQQLSANQEIIISKPVALQSAYEASQRQLQRDEVRQVFQPNAPTQIERLAQPQAQLNAAPPIPGIAHSQAYHNKEFFYISAPPDDYVSPRELEDQLAKQKKNLRIVFIKAPEQNGLADAALKLAKHSIEQQTKIYVLTKQHNVGDLAHKLNNIQPTTAAKPEVIFVKYRTPQEAANAQRTIQAQYEALDGPNFFNYESVAPTHNFVAAKEIIEPRTTANGETVATPAGNYLPVATNKIIKY